MKQVLFALCILFFFSCKEKHEKLNTEISKIEDNKILNPEFQTLIDSAHVVGSILIYDLKKDLYYSNNFKWADSSHIPASTFKIVNTIIGFETGVIENDRKVFKWDGEEKWSSNWEQDLNLKDAFQFSCVPCYQELAREIGTDNMIAYVEKLNYGNLKIDSTTIDTFWLRGDSRVSQMQQIDFLKRFYNSELPISKRTKNIVSDIMIMEETNQYKLSGKTGLSNSEIYNGWFVGYMELENNTYIFATNLTPKNEFDLNDFISKRKDLTLEALSILKVIN